MKKFDVVFRKEKLWDHNNRPFPNKISLLFTLLIMLQIALDGARSHLRSRINYANNTSLVLWSLYIWVAPKWKHLKCQKPICSLVLDSFTIWFGFQTDRSMIGVGYKNTEPSYFCGVGKVYISLSLIRG